MNSDQTGEEHPLAADQVAEPAGQQQQAAEGDQVAVDDPREVALARSAGRAGSTAARRSRSSRRAPSSAARGRARRARSSSALARSGSRGLVAELLVCSGLWSVHHVLMGLLPLRREHHIMDHPCFRDDRLMMFMIVAKMTNHDDRCHHESSDAMARRDGCAPARWCSCRGWPSSSTGAATRSIWACTCAICGALLPARPRQLPPAGARRGAVHGRQQRRAAAQRARGSRLRGARRATPTTAAATASR